MKTRYKILLVIVTSVILYLIMHSIYLFNVCEFIVNSSDNWCMIFWNVDTSIHITSDIWDSNNGIGEWSGTTEDMEESTAHTDLKNNSGFIFWHMILPTFTILMIYQRDRNRK